MSTVTDIPYDPDVPSSEYFVTDIPSFVYNKEKDPYYDPDVLPIEYFQHYPASSVDSDESILSFFERRGLAVPLDTKEWGMTVLITTEDVSVVPFQMQERFKIVGWSMKLFEALGLRYGGICLVKTDDVRAFHASYRNAQEQVKKIAQEEDERVRKTWAKHNLLPYLDIAFDLIECKDLLHPTSEDLSRNRVMKWTASADELPKCVQTKKDQMEAKRQWPNMRQRLTISAEVSFETRGLSMYEFFEREQSTDQSSEDPSSTQSTDIPMLETSPNVFMLEATCISTIAIFSERLMKPSYLQEHARDWTFLPLLNLVQKSDHFPADTTIKLPSAETPLPHHMGFLCFRKGKEGSKAELHLTHYKPDVVMVDDYFIILMGEIYSRTKESARGDLQRLLLRAAFYIHFMKLALKQQQYVLPVFFVNSEWQG